MSLCFHILCLGGMWDITLGRELEMCVACGGEGKGGKRVDRSMAWAHNHLALSSVNAVEHFIGDNVRMSHLEV